jgi:hypothetical protein
MNSPIKPQESLLCMCGKASALCAIAGGCNSQIDTYISQSFPLQLMGDMTLVFIGLSGLMMVFITLILIKKTCSLLYRLFTPKLSILHPTL